MTKVNRLVWIVFCIILHGTIVLGQPQIDSLLIELKHASSNLEKAQIYVKLSSADENVNRSLVYATQALEVLEGEGSPALRAKVFQCIGRSHANLQQPDSAHWYLLKSLDLFDQINHIKGKAKSIYFMAFAFEQKHLLDSAKTYYDWAINLSDSIGDTSNYAYYNLNLGNLENVRGNNKAALKHLSIANDYFNVPERIDSAWISLNSLAIVYDEIGLYPEALGYYLKAYEIVEASNDKEAKLILANNLGAIYHSLGKLEEAKDYYAKGLELAKANALLHDEAMLLNNLSIVYTEERDTLGALKLLRRAHSIQESATPDCDLAYSYEGLGEVMVWQKKYDSAEFYYTKAMDWASKCGMSGSQTSIYRNMGLLAIKRSEPKKAESLLRRSLELGSKSNFALEMKETTKELFQFYHNVGDLENALKYHLLYSSLKDSLFNAQSTEKIARMTAEYDYRREIESLEYKKMADEMRLNEELRQKETNQNSILIVLVLTLLLAATLGRSYYLVQNHNKKLTALNEEKNTLMGVVAHDLRSPLNNIKGLISLVKMEKSSLTPEQSHYFHLVDDTMERMRDMIDRVLDISVVEDMKVNLNLRKVDLGETINFVAGNFELLASKKSIQIHSNLNKDKHFVFADYNYLLQVIENLISNAIKFSETGKNIFMNVFQEDGSETMIVRDEGPGISEEDKKRLFTKFQKLSAKPTDNEQSTGLGLSIVKKFVDAMDAEISCESEVGVGTSFIIKFKAAAEQEVLT